jgi:uncharacterized integral membrane protein
LLQYTATEIADFANSRGTFTTGKNHRSEFDDFAAHSAQSLSLSTSATLRYALILLVYEDCSGTDYMNLTRSKLRTAAPTIVGILIAILVGMLIGGLVAVFLITQLWGRVPMWMVSAG